MLKTSSMPILLQ